MSLLERLEQRWRDVDEPFLIHRGQELRMADLRAAAILDLSCVRNGDVVALVGDFEPVPIATLLRLIDMSVVIVPLTVDTEVDHQYFFDTAFVDVVIDGGVARRLRDERVTHPLIESLRTTGHSGLILFSTGVTGKPKAILHDMTFFMRRFETPRPTLRTLSFLLFDHIGGINTLFHTIFNGGVVVAPTRRTVSGVLDCCNRLRVELLPTTPTFLRMMLISGALPDKVPPSLRVITYGTERMDEATLRELCALLPDVDFRQTFGMSEVGIVRVKSESRDSLFMKIGGDGVDTRVVNGVLQIRSSSRMLGYLNATSPFDDEGWYNTGDIVEQKGELIRVVGRTSDVINVGGLKFMPSEVEAATMKFAGVAHVKALGRPNPITGQHVELLVESLPGKIVDLTELNAYLKRCLQPHMIPKRIRLERISVGHRFKRL